MKQVQFKPGDTIVVDQFPPGSSLFEKNYMHFLCDVLASFRKSFAFDDEQFSRHFETAGFLADEIRPMIKLFNSFKSGTIDLEKLAEQIHAALRNPPELEVALNSILMSKGYRHSTPQTRSEMSRKLFEACTTEILTKEEKIRYIDAFGTSIISRMIAEEG
ncbi:MAG: hypothetical protein JWO73_828 [Candidatus Taylorbacteria bacterium]|nr:hypothetical protein [Candidatus Taylorbacteria bacterium]